MVRAVGLYPIGRGFNPHPAYHFNDCETINLALWKDRESWGVSITDSAAGFYPALWGFDSLTPRHIGPVAQPVERRTLNPQVVGSSPTRSTKSQTGEIMSFETKKKIEIAVVIIGSVILFAMPIFVMMAA